MARFRSTGTMICVMVQSLSLFRLETEDIPPVSTVTSRCKVGGTGIVSKEGLVYWVLDLIEKYKRLLTLPPAFSL